METVAAVERRHHVAGPMSPTGKCSCSVRCTHDVRLAMVGPKAPNLAPASYAECQLPWRCLPDRPVDAGQTATYNTNSVQASCETISSPPASAS